jgi:hypothetical protein
LGSIRCALTWAATLRPDRWPRHCQIQAIDRPAVGHERPNQRWMRLAPKAKFLYGESLRGSLEDAGGSLTTDKGDINRPNLVMVELHVTNSVTRARVPGVPRMCALIVSATSAA